MSTSRMDMGRELEEALAWLFHQQRDLSEAYRLLDTARCGGWVPYDVLIAVLNDIEARQQKAAEHMRNVRSALL